jgi:hypothetical protein
MIEPRHATILERFADHGRIERALQGAVRQALRRHQEAGYPVATWRDGRVVWVPAEEIPMAAPDEVGGGTIPPAAHGEENQR